jgi:hypothetical protein
MFSSQQDDLGKEAMEKDEPPEGDFLALLPPNIHVFDLEDKTWSKDHALPCDRNLSDEPSQNLLGLTASQM